MFRSFMAKKEFASSGLQLFQEAESKKGYYWGFGMAANYLTKKNT